MAPPPGRDEWWRYRMFWTEASGAYTTTAINFHTNYVYYFNWADAQRESDYLNLNPICFLSRMSNIFS